MAIYFCAFSILLVVASYTWSCEPIKSVIRLTYISFLRRIEEVSGSQEIPENYFFVCLSQIEQLHELQHDEIKELFSRIAKGDQAAFDQLFYDQYDRIYSTALVYGKVHELAEDIAQQVFLQVWEKRASLVNVTKPLAWLQTAARYAIRDAFDRQLVRDKYRKRILATFQEVQDSPEELLVRMQQQEILTRAIESLSGRSAEVYKLSREQGMTYEQIAVHLDIGKESVKEYMSTALKKIRIFLLNHGDALFSLLIIFF